MYIGGRKETIIYLLMHSFLNNFFDYEFYVRHYGKYWLYNRRLFITWDHSHSAYSTYNNNCINIF